MWVCHFLAGLAVFGFLSIAAPEAGAYVEPRLKPAAPGPTYLTPADHARLEVIINAVKRKNFSIARTTADTIEDPIAKSLGQWLYFYGEDPNVNIADADYFLDLHQDWPAASRIQSHVEKRIKNSTPADIVLDFFDTRDPIGGHGKLHLARAQFSKGDQAAGEIHLRDAWVNHTFALKDERRILANYASRLRPEDHAARVDHLLWKRQVTNARRVISRLTSSERRKAETRAALLLAAKDGPRLFDSLNTKDRSDPGVMLAAVRYFRRAGEEPRAISIARLAPTEPEALRNPSRWWYEQRLLVRWALKEGRYDDAYAMAAGHGLEPGTDYSEAEFYAGWLALRYLDAPERAEIHFKALAANVSAPISVARAFYWLGRTAEERKADELARSYYDRASRHIYTFYGQLAAEKIGGNALTQTFGKSPRPSPSESTRFALRPTVAALRMLSDLKDDQAFLVFSYHVDDRLESPGEYLELAELTNGRGAPHMTVRAGKVSVRRKAFAPEVSYPIVYVPEEATRYAPAEVILGLSRQESEFNPRAYSRAGARGLMQLIPSTAQITARKEGLRYSRSALLDDPIYNMTIGSAHLSHLFQKYNGSYVMTFSAYNAGPHRVTQWVEAFGDPRSPDIDPIDWAESIPFTETRNYVQRVLENTQIYRGQFNKAPIPGKLSGDLERGGKRGRAGEVPAVKYAGALAPLPARTEKFAGAAPLKAPEAQLKPTPSSPSDAKTTATGLPGIKPIDPATAPISSPKQEAPASTDVIAPVEKPSPVRAEATQSQIEPEIPSDSADNAEPARALTTQELNALQLQESTPQQTKSLTQELSPVAPTLSQTKPVQEPSMATADELNALQSDVLADTDSQNTSPEPAPIAKAPTSETDLTNMPSVQKPAAIVSENCETYRNYIARTEKEDAEADDLNAGMLAELKGGGVFCE